MLEIHCKLSVSLCYCPKSEGKLDRAMGHFHAQNTVAHRSRCHLSLNQFFRGTVTLDLQKHSIQKQMSMCLSNLSREFCSLCRVHGLQELCWQD